MDIGSKLSFAFVKPGQNSYNDDIRRMFVIKR